MLCLGLGRNSSNAWRNRLVPLLESALPGSASSYVDIKGLTSSLRTVAERLAGLPSDANSAKVIKADAECEETSRHFLTGQVTTHIILRFDGVVNLLDPVSKACAPVDDFNLLSSDSEEVP